MELIASRQVAFSDSVRVMRTLPLQLDRQASVVTLRIPLPTTANPDVGFGKDDAITAAIILEVDGETLRCEGVVRGGVHPIHGGPSEATEYTLSWQLPFGYFGESNTDPRKWASIKPRRIGETTKRPVLVTFEIVPLRGVPGITFTADCQIEEAPQNWEYHHSVAYDTAGSVAEYHGDGTVSFSFTAGSGSDRAVFVAAAVDGSGAPASTLAITYGGASPTVADLWSSGFGTWLRARGNVFKDSEMGSGAKTVQAVSSLSPDGGLVVGCISVTGVDQTTPVGTPQTSGSDSGTPRSVTVTGLDSSGGLLVDAIASWGANPIVGANQTDRTSATGGIDADAIYFHMSSQASSSGGDMSWSSLSGESVLGAVEFKPAGAATKAPPPYRRAPRYYTKRRAS